MNMKEPWAAEELALQPTRRRQSHWVARIALAVGLLSFVGVVAWGAYALLGHAKPMKKQIVQISLLRPPPPPPPPPPEQKPPEPVAKEELKMPEPEQPQQEDPSPPQSEQLGLDTDGSGNGDNFGLAAKKGGTDITRIGGTSGAGGSERAWFAGVVQSHLQAELSKNQRLRHADYRVSMRIWFAADGRIQRFEIVGSTGDRALDDSIKVAMDQMPALKQPPPATIEQPVRLRVTSRGAG
jgi:periplasmic protein TonB